MTIQQGDTVRWVKPAGGFHNVNETSHSPATFRSGDPTTAAFTYSFAFAAPLEGVFNYECEIHAPGMVGSVTVEAGGTPPSTPTNPIPNNNSTSMPLLGFLDLGKTREPRTTSCNSVRPTRRQLSITTSWHDVLVFKSDCEYTVFLEDHRCNGDGETAGPI
ncbi:MAG: hypothetical protein IPP40_17595 [bacterium]|nr:hypothetical protein [bacterium]